MAHLKTGELDKQAVCGLLGPSFWMPVLPVRGALWHMTGKQYYLQEDVKGDRVLCSECANHPLVLLAELGGVVL
jgi:hypothetical protein